MPADHKSQLRTRAFARVIGPYVATFGIVYAIRLPELGSLIGDLFASPAATIAARVFFAALGLLGLVLAYAGWFRAPARTT